MMVRLLFGTGQTWILSEGINFAILNDVLMLIECFARLIHLRFSGALRTTVQHLIQGKDEILIEGNIIVGLNDADCMFSQINSSHILQSIENYDGDSTSDYFLLTVLDRLIVMYIALF